MTAALTALGELAAGTAFNLFVFVEDSTINGTFTGVVGNRLLLGTSSITTEGGTVRLEASMSVSICDIIGFTVNALASPLFFPTFVAEYPAIFTALFPDTITATTCPNCADDLRTALVEDFAPSDPINVVADNETVTTSNFNKRTDAEIKQGIVLLDSTTTQGTQPFVLSLCHLFAVAEPLPTPI